jgi:hypothetical protein
VLLYALSVAVDAPETNQDSTASAQDQHRSLADPMGAGGRHCSPPQQQSYHFSRDFGPGFSYDIPLQKGMIS